MARIVWQSKSPSLYEAFSSGGLSADSGGTAYEFHAARALAQSHDVSFDANAVRPVTMPLTTYVRQLRNSWPEADVIVKQTFPIVFGRRIPGVANIGIVHHVDLAAASRSPRFAIFNTVLRRRLRSMDAVVTVSQFWRDYLERSGCGNVRVIYNSFTPDEYEVSGKEISVFLEKYNINIDKPIIYIGNASASKGVYEVYNQLADKDYTLVMTGRQNGAPDLPARFFSLPRRDYLILLKASSVVVTYSRMLEGWNRVAHEAMLMGTPVVGSGTGGMRELLTRGGQGVAEHAGDLPQLVDDAISNRDQLGAIGQTYARQFDDAYWHREWDELVRSVA